MTETTIKRPTVVFTGGSAGIGRWRATLREVAGAGYAVTVLAGGQAGLDGAARSVETVGGRCLPNERPGYAENGHYLPSPAGPTPQVLLVVATRGASSLKDLSDATHLRLSRASRACKRLVGKDLITRRDDPDHRGVLQLGLTPDGEAVVRTVHDARREAVASVLAAMSATRRTELVYALRAFAYAAGEVSHGDMSALARTQ